MTFLLFFAQCRPAEGSDRERMRRGLCAPGAPDEWRRKPGTKRACVFLLGRNRHESDLFVQQGRY